MQDQAENQSPAAELPRWKCHKQVWGFKITGIELDSDKAHAQNRETDGSALLLHDEGYFLPVRVDHTYLRKHQPKAGGYYVQYADGYKSFSPAEAFEGGYTRI